MGNCGSCCRRNNFDCGYNNGCYIPSRCNNYNYLMPITNSGFYKNSCGLPNTGNNCLNTNNCFGSQKYHQAIRRITTQRVQNLHYHIMHLPQHQYFDNRIGLGHMGSSFGVGGPATTLAFNNGLSSYSGPIGNVIDSSSSRHGYLPEPSIWY